MNGYMNEYINNFKSLIKWKDNQTDNICTNSNELDKFEIIEKSILKTNLEVEQSPNPNPSSNFNEIKYLHDKIHDEMIEKEQLVRQRLDSDTVEKIKTDYTEYLDNDIKIIQDFANIINTFEQIQSKLNDFESDIKEFELDIRKKTKSNEENNNELNERIDLIDTKLNETIDLMKSIKSDSDNCMKHILKLENGIIQNETKGQQILNKINNVETIKVNDKIIKFKLLSIGIFSAFGTFMFLKFIFGKR